MVIGYSDVRHSYIQRFKEAQSQFSGPRLPDRDTFWEPPMGTSVNRNLLGAGIGIMAHDADDRLLVGIGDGGLNSHLLARHRN